ncbi:MAG: hypothetical protein NW217_02410 [Hyphomicrobiaceae bacterium]|nr:hypothetical protein [Hyphomicrobiaceae bacterium]
MVPALGSSVLKSETQSDGLAVTEALILVRIAAQGGASRAEIVRDLGMMFAHRLSPAQWRETVDTDTARLVEAGHIGLAKGRFTALESGRLGAEAFLGRAGSAAAAWPEIRDGRLIARALGLESLGPTRIKAVQRPDGLRALILQKGFGLPLNGNQTTSKLRAQLAVVALERAFGNKIKTGLGAGSGFSAKAGRMLAGQLSARPRDFGTDGGLVAALAAELVDARQTDLDSLRLAILRRLATSGSPGSAAVTGSAPAALAPRRAANDAGLPGAALPPNRRPDPAGFARHVKVAARQHAEGWGGNRKALISKVWETVSAAHPDWGLSEIEFKCMLAEAHRSGHLVLASIDLKNARNAGELAASAISYKNTVWHLIRVADDEDAA